MSKKQEIDPGTSGPIDELVARFQVETDAKLKEMAAVHLREIQGMHRQVAQCRDSVVALEDRCTKFDRSIDDATASMRAGLREVNTALRVAVDQTRQAQEAAAVFDKLKSSQPDFHAMVRELQVKLGAVRTEQTHTNARINEILKKLDEFDLVAEDVEETRTVVRGLDPIVKNLNDMSKRAGAR